MTITLPADAGDPMSATLVASANVQYHKFPAVTRQVSLRNNGTNTLWYSTDKGESWNDVACGTSWEDRVTIDELWYCTQVDFTEFAVAGLTLIGID